MKGNVRLHPPEKYFPVRKSRQVRNWRSVCHNHTAVCTLMNAELDPFPNLYSVMKRREGLSLQHYLVSQVNTQACHPCDLQIGFAIKLFTNLYLQKCLLKGCYIVCSDMLFAFKVLAVLVEVGLGLCSLQVMQREHNKLKCRLR